MPCGGFDEKNCAAIAFFGLYVMRNTNGENRDDLLAELDF
jgi:hypothetical protein